MKNISILGSTGSVGCNALEIVRKHSGYFNVKAITANTNVELMLNQINEFKPELVVMSDAESANQVRERAARTCKVLSGKKALIEAASYSGVELVIAASSGSTSLIPVVTAIELGKNIAIANKEILVMAGSLIMTKARESGSSILPVDSEHNAIFQALQGNGDKNIRSILLTGSGGPMKNVDKSQFEKISPEEAINHPKWKMGKKISVDSATMMNKGLEIIEARWLFGVEADKIKVLIHPEAIIHSMVEYIDGSIIAQMGATDMKLPLLHTMAFPDRLDDPSMSISLTDIGVLNFEEPDLGKFDCLRHALHAANYADTTLPCVLNAADEVAVMRFLQGDVLFSDIPDIIRKTMDGHKRVESPSIDLVLEVDKLARAEANRHADAFAKKKISVKNF